MQNKDLDKEYLHRMLIPDVMFKVTADQIRVYSNDTEWISCRRPQKLIQKDLLALYSAVVKKAKQKHIKLTYKYHHKKFILQNWLRYTNEYTYYNDVYALLLSKMEFLQARGIHYGCSDDAYLQECIKLNYKLREMYNATSYTSKMSAIKHELEQTLKDITSFEGITKIWL